MRIALLLLLFVASLSAKKILFIESYHEQFSWSQQIVSGIQEALKDRSEIEMHLIRMDTKRNPHADQIAKIESLLADQIKNIEFDAVVVSDDPAYHFALREANRLFANKPVVFCGVNLFEPSEIANKPNVIGLVEQISPKETIITAIKLQPNIKSFVVVGTTATLSERLNLANIRKTEELFNDISFEYIVDSHGSALQEKISKLDGDKAVLLTGVVLDDRGKILNFEERTKLVRESSKVPIYSFWKHTVGSGAVGGMIVDAKKHGFYATKIALQLLDGRNIADIDLSSYPINSYLFDYKELKRFGIAFSRLPPNFEIINSPKTTLEALEEKRLEIIVALLFALLILTIVIFVAKNRYSQKMSLIVEELEEEVKARRVAKAEIARINQGLQKLVDEQVSKVLYQEKLLVQQSKMAIVGEMISAIAHQWRQPLNIISILTQTLHMDYEDGLLDDKAISEFEEDVLEHIDFMSRTIEDFRGFLKPSKEMGDFDIKEPINGLFKLFGKQFTKNNIEIIIDIADDLPQIHGMRSEFQQVLLNLYTNSKDAILHKKDRDPAVIEQITTTAKLDGNSIVISIKDSGGGIPEEFISRLFEYYATTKGDGGTGIGLYMSKMIIEETFKGTITAKNLEKGAEFTITIPTT